MSQSDFLRQTMSDFFDELDSEGLDESGTFSADGISFKSGCRGIVNRGIAATNGAFARAVGRSISIRLLIADLPAAPKRGATWRIQSQTFGTETFKLIEELGNDGALATWQVEYA